MRNILSCDALAVAKAGANKLAELTLESGKFSYRYGAISNAKLSGYNVLIHSKTIWSMLDVSSVAKDEQLLTAANRAITYLFNEHLRFFRSYLNFYILEKK